MKFEDIDLKGRTSGQFKTQCPECSHLRSDKKDTCLSVNITEGIYNCHHCGAKGTKKVYEVKKKYTLPQFTGLKLSESTLGLIISRGISQSTIIRFGLSEGLVWMPQAGKEELAIHFNYFRGGELVNIKYRDANKNFKMISGAELIFYGLDLIDGNDTCVICEGEYDAMSFYEAGFTSVVSVPNGASKGNQKLEYLDNCWEYFEDKKTIILATDNDEAGIALRDELARRLGKDRCKIFQFPDDCKDANEILIKHGGDYLKKQIEKAIDYPIEGIIEIKDIDSEINDLYYNGYPTGQKVGFENFDKLLSFRGGEMTVITGIPGSGKSEFTDQILMKLAESGWKVGLFSAENQPVYLHFSKLAEKYIGQTFYSQFNGSRMSLLDLDRAKEFIGDNFFFVEIGEQNISLEALLEKMIELVKRKGINAYVIDPWNYIEHKIPQGYTETQYISEALTKVCRAAKMYNVHIFVVAHPTKIKKNQSGKYEIATLYDISGSAHWFNKTDNGMSVYRDFETGIVDVYVQKVRFKFMGKQGFSSFEWNRWNGRYTELNQASEINIQPKTAPY